MKHFSSILLLLIGVVLPTLVSAQQPMQWQPTSGPSNGIVFQLVRSASGKVFAACGTGGIAVSTDNGSTWQWKNDGITDSTMRAVAVLGTTLLAGTSNGTIYRSDDDGEHWTFRATLNFPITSMAFATATLVYAGTNGNEMFTSTNGGTSWQPSGISDQFGFTNFKHVAALQALPGGKIIAGFRSVKGFVYTSPFPGFRWTYSFSGEERFISFFTTRDSTVMLGSTTGVHRTVSSYPFNSVTSFTTGVPSGEVFAVAADTTDRLFASIGGKGIYRSVDGGASWHAVNTGLDWLVVRTLLPLPNGYLLAGSDDGIVYRTAAATNGLIVPTPAAVTDTLLPADTVRLRWKDVSGATSYRVNISTDSTFTTAMVIDTVVPSSVVAVHGLIPRTMNYWRVRAENGVEVTSYSSPAQPLIVGPTLDPPHLLLPDENAVNVPVGNIIFRWNAVPSATGYRLVVQSVDDQSLYRLEGTPKDTTVTWSIPEHARKFQWQVRTKSIAGFGAASSPRTFSTMINPPLYPVLAMPADYSQDLDTNIVLRWRGRSDTRSYVVQISKNSSFSSVLVFHDSTVTDTAVTAKGLAFGQRYYWRVFGVNEGGRSGSSDVFTFTTTGPPPQAPTLQEPANGAVELPQLTLLRWSVSSFDSAFVWLTTDTTDWFGNGVGGTVHSLSVMVILDPGATYYWRVAAWNKAGMGAWSDVHWFRISGSRTIDHDPSGIPREFRLYPNYPNPFNGGTKITVDIADFHHVNLSVYTVAGTLAATLIDEPLAPGKYTVRWNPRDMASGVYLCRITTSSLSSSFIESLPAYSATVKLLYLK